MGRAVAVLALCVFLAAVITTASAQHNQGSNAVQQTPGFMERIMTRYVYPLRDYDWRGMIRGLIDNVMNYISPSTKEPKAGYGTADPGAELTDIFLHTVYVSLVESMLSWEARKYLENGGEARGDTSSAPSNGTDLTESLAGAMRLALGPILNWGPTTNSFITPNVAAYSWDYLGYLLLFTGVSIVGAFVPLFQHIPLEDEASAMDYMTGMMGEMGMMGDTGMMGEMGTMGITDETAMTGSNYRIGSTYETEMTGYETASWDEAYERPVYNYVRRRQG